RLVIAQSGGITFLQQLALLGSVYGFVDVLVKFQTDDVVAEATMPQTNCSMQELGAPPMQSSDDGPTSDGAGPSDGNGAGDSDQSATDSLLPAAGSASGEDASSAESPAGASQNSLQALSSLARRVRLEIVEPARALPILSPEACR